MANTERIPLTDGALIYWRHQTAWLDARPLGLPRQSLKTHDQDEAIRKGVKIIQEWKAATAKTAQPIVVPLVPAETIIQQTPTKGLGEYTLLQASKLYEAWYKKHNRWSSYQRTLPVLNSFLAWVGNDRPVSALSRRLVSSWFEKRAESVSPFTANGDLTRISGFCSFMLAEEMIDKNPCYKIRKLKTRTTAKAARTQEEVTALMKRLEGHWLHDYANLLLQTGMRPGEGLHIRACDVDETKKLLRLRAWGEWELKDSEDRALALNAVAWEICKRLKDRIAKPEGLLFPTPTGFAWDIDNWSKVWRLKAGKGFGAYDLRHLFASRAVEAGWPLEKLSRYMGHADTKTTMRYYADMRALSEVGAPPVLVS